MKAIVATAYGPPDVLQLREVEKPVPKDDEVLIKIHTAAATAASLSGRKGDPLFARLFMGLTKPKNSVLGQELAGVIEAVGKDVTQFKEGDRVFGNPGTTLGAYAEYICLSEDAPLVEMPPDLTFDEAAAVVEGGVTALNFFRKANLQRGQKVLINGASGSVGTASIQVAKHLGAEVTGVCSTTNVALVQSLGADQVIDYTQEDFTKNGETYDIIFDTVGKRSFSECKGSLSNNGIYLDAAGVATLVPMLWTSVFGGKKAILLATYVRPATALKEDLISVKELVEAGTLRAVIDRCYALAETAEAHRYVETGRKKGNVVIAMGEVG